ncbi:uncharacterized protein K489DRAFT_367175 [Dissoconium aciculare CBS 342.82]|jgi:hypothetical protein|uniref:Uncharacterized protein n=1 Tax=Dissoconium aciculare CBS 342.82 TaxID=1314786 RepID=A0A6J3ME63_9PEZI|nr:uncharacterized protein K489DRAFT_367175 [Dissoconium aciculare CBS 342.82]KAF1825899.1 hypothetical protein K489DRAFT_367175 [Dissoconium aciculare CBS 342.82]
MASSKKRNRSFESISIGSALVILGCGLIAYIEEGPQALKLLHGYEVIVSLGLGIVLVSGTIVIKLAAQPQNAGLLSRSRTEAKYLLLASAAAQGLQGQMRLLGGNISLSIATIILNARLSSDL